jgi:hypothetical protein
MEECRYENFPRWMVASTILVQLAVCVLGAYIVLQIGIVFLVIYVACILALEYRLLRYHCVDCYYYGKRCCFGKGRLSALFFGKGDPEKFLGKEIGWRDILPDFLISVVPLVLGIGLLLISFDPVLLAAVVALAILAFPGSGFIRGRWACRYCRQREPGCPAEQLFNRKRREEAR